MTVALGVIAAMVAACTGRWPCAAPLAPGGVAVVPGSTSSTASGPLIGTHEFTLTAGGATRSYTLHVPPGLPAAVPVALLIELHGGGGSGRNIDRLTGFFALADREGFVVAAPSGIGGNWNDGRDEVGRRTGAADDVGFIAELIDRVAAQVPIDRGRVYVTGISNGAMMAGRLACELSTRIAAVAQVAGTAAVDIAASCRPGRAVPLLEIHGTADPLVPYAGGAVLAGLGGGRGAVVGVDAWARLWVGANGDAPDPVITALGADTTVRTWSGSTPASDVAFYRVDGAGHTWPGGPQYLPRVLIGSTTHTFDASEVIWAFVSRHRLEAAG